MKRIVLLISLLLLSAGLYAQQKTYYVSPSGNDAASGLSVKDAWKSIDKINSVTFQPGDKILLESGKTFPGQMVLKGSGTPENPILLSSFGGPERPVIDMGREDGNAITLTDASGWEIIGLEITSGFPPEVGVGRSGIVVNATGEGVAYKHLVIKDNYIHDVWGQMGGTRTRNTAISVSVGGPRRAPGTAQTPYVAPTFDDVLIEGNRIERVDKVGITTSGIDGVRVRRNWMDNLGGDGIIVSGSYRGLIEFNEIHRSCMRSGTLDLPGDTAWNEGKDGWWPHTAACWIIRCEETIMQFNEVYDTGRQIRNGDGFAYDFDFYCKNCLCQYNYSKENHGFLLLMYDIFQNTARYNISENDKTHLVQMQGSLKNDSNFLYNNVFYVDHGTLDLDFFRGDFADRAKDVNDLGAHFYNNIFYAAGQGRFRWEYSTGFAWDRSFDSKTRPTTLPAGSIFLHNCYFGPWLDGMPDDPEALVADPKFVAPGTGGNGLNTLCGYMLRPDSPCINTGMYVPNAGTRDFFGNALEDGHPDFGAFEAVGTGVFADTADLAAQDKDASDASSVAWSKWCFPLGLPVDKTDAVPVKLYRPLEDGVTGTVTWVNPKGGKPVTIDLSKVKDRGAFSLPVKSDRETLLASTVKVELKKGKFTESFEIPFAEKPATRR